MSKGLRNKPPIYSCQISFSTGEFRLKEVDDPLSDKDLSEIVFLKGFTKE
jgi:hypothetical protein